jgi:HK97 family phage major capsid protein
MADNETEALTEERLGNIIEERGRKIAQEELGAFISKGDAIRQGAAFAQAFITEGNNRKEQNANEAYLLYYQDFLCKQADGAGRNELRDLIGKYEPLKGEAERWARLKTTLTTGGSNTGAELVPTLLLPIYIRLRDQAAPYLARTTRIPVTSMSGTLPTEKSLPTGTRTAETSDATESNLQTDNVSWTITRLDTFMVYSREILYAAVMPEIGAYVAETQMRGLVLKDMAEFINGTGSSQPLGLHNDTAIADVSMAGASFDWVDLISLEEAVKDEYKGGAIFLMNQKTRGIVRKTKAATTGQPIYEDARQGLPATMHGYPVYTNSNISSTLGGSSNTSEIFYGDPALWYYFELAGSAPTSEASIHHKFLSHAVTVTSWKWNDGKLITPTNWGVLNAVK